MGFLGRIFGSEKAVSGMVDGLTNGLDKLFYTKEEQADDHAATVTEARQMLIRWMDSTKGQNLSRRFIALLITAVWLFIKLCAVGLGMVSVFISSPVIDGVLVDRAQQYTEAAQIVGQLGSEMTGAMMLILAFYFAAPHMASIVSGAMQKFSGDKK